MTAEAQNFFRDELKVEVKTSEDACAQPKINEFIIRCIEETNKSSTSRAAHIRKFKLLGTDFSIPGGELTPTLKLKRKVTEKKYQAEIDKMFDPTAKL